MHFRTSMFGGEPYSGSSGTARNFWRAGSVGSRSFPGEGGRDEAGERALGAAFDKGGAERVTRLYLRDDLPEDQCWLRAPGWGPGLPLMYPAFYIRPARVEEAAALSDLCFRSKAVWGYDPEFMALMLAALGVPERTSLPAMCGSRPGPTDRLPASSRSRPAMSRMRWT